MFSAETELLPVAVKQYCYKLKSHLGFAFGFVTTQTFALLSGISAGSFSSGGQLSVTVRRYSSDVSLFFACAWIFFLAIALNGVQEEKKGFTMVANRASNHLANIGVMLTAWLYGGTASALFLGLQIWFVHFSSGQGEFMDSGFHLTGESFALILGANLLYLLLLTAGSYLTGVLVRISSLFAIILPAALLGLAHANVNAFMAIIKFFSAEASLPVFALKVIATALVLFGLSVVISSRLEVKG